MSEVATLAPTYEKEMMMVYQLEIVLQPKSKYGLLKFIIKTAQKRKSFILRQNAINDNETQYKL